ncbi:ABC transporter ATP-binding protein [Clostridium tagluense]|uniref:ABC transporter n=1 Tax=Clostridium tagluense TaxID=360422 RepID=A0A401UPG0_9CLOT|nr:ABC transporter ATP-binding protein [Clostridium tagluense]GCD11414.1 ABC transporter [Clostridium tagluense]
MENHTWIKKDKRLIVSIFLNIIEGILTGSVLGSIFLTIDSLFQNKFDLSKLINLCILVACIFIVRLVLYSIGYTLGHVGASSTAKGIRLFLGNKIKNLPLINFSKYKTGEFINVVTHDVNNYEDILGHKTGEIAKNLTLSTVTLLFLCSVDISIGAVNLIIALLIIPFMIISSKMVKKYGGMKKDILNDNVSDLVEYINGIQTFRSYGLGGVKNKKINRSLKNISDISYKFESKVVPIGCIYRVVEDISVPLSIILGGYQWILGEISSSQYVICVILALFISQLMGNLFIDLTSYKNLMISKKSMDNLAKQKEDTYLEIEFDPANYDIEFKNVSFNYIKDQPILKNISFKAKNGELTAIVGDSGSGKSTILNLISKFYEIEQGDIKIGGVNTKNINGERVLKNVSMVYQDVFLFNDSIKNNIRFAKPEASDQEIVSACKASNCHEFISKLEKGYDTFIGENGNRLSGGEKQRISIARAILKDSPIILLDEATASLDIENELYVKEAISKLISKNKTLIIIAHNLSVVKNADNILVVSDGKIIEQGNHEKLIKKRGKYYSMWGVETSIH